MCGSSTKTTTQNQSTSTNYPAWATAAGQNDYNNASSYLGSHPWQGYSGPTEASFGPQTQAASGFLTGELGQNNQSLNAASNAVTGMLGNLDPTKTAADYMNPYVSATLAPTLQNLSLAQQQATGELGANSAMSGAFGDTTRGVQQGLLDRNYMQQVGNATGQAYDNAYSAGQQQQNNVMQQILGGAGQLQNIGSAENYNNNNITSQLAGLGAQEQQAGQTGITNAIQLNTQNQTMPLQQQTQLQQLLAMSPMDTTGTMSGTGKVTTPDNSGLALLGSLFSAIPFPG